MKSSSLSSSSSTSPNRRIVVALVTAAICFMLVIGFYADDVISERIDSITTNDNKTLPLSLPRHRKLLHKEAENVNGNVTERGVEPNRIWSEKCSKSDIVISQGHTEPLPSGIPTYTVEIMNVCISGCDISAIHLTCGWFSSARLINPRVFKRLGFDDCLVNDGKPLASGRALSFQYANTYPYSLSVSSLRC